MQPSLSPVVAMHRASKNSARQCDDYIAANSPSSTALNVSVAAADLWTASANTSTICARAQSDHPHLRYMGLTRYNPRHSGTTPAPYHCRPSHRHFLSKPVEGRQTFSYFVYRCMLATTANSICQSSVPLAVHKCER